MNFLNDLIINPDTVTHAVGQFYVKVDAFGKVVKTSNVEETDPTVAGYIKAITTGNINSWNQAFGWGNHSLAGYLTGITSGQVTGALGFTPYNASNPSGYITSAALSPYQLSSGLGSNAFNSTAFLPLSGGTLTGSLDINNGLLVNAQNSSFHIRLGQDRYNTSAHIRVTPNLHLNSPQGSIYLNWDGGGTPAVIFGNAAAGELSRINTSGNFTGSAASISNQANSATISATTGVDGNNIVRRDPNGYIFANHINFNTGESENPPINSFFTSNGDGWSRKSNLQHVKNSIRGVADGNWGINITGNAARASRANGNFYIDDNFGCGVVGVYDSFRYQGVFAMGDAYKLPANGTSTGGLYGLAWSHPNAGGVASNLNDHGLLVINNGVFQAAISSSIRAASDMRAPIFYDSQDTGFYLDPNGTSNLNAFTEATFARLGKSRYRTNRSQHTPDTNYWTGTNGWGTGEGNWANAWKGGFSGWDIWGTGTDHPQGGGYIHAQGIVSGQHYASSDGGTAYGWMMVGAADATENRYWLRGKWAGGTSGWREMITSGNIGSQSVNYANSAGSLSNMNISQFNNDSSYWQNDQDRTIRILRFGGVGGDSGVGNQGYAIYQQAGPWSWPFPDLHIGFHTGIKIGGHWTYGGTRFYNNSDMEVLLFSVGNGDQNVRVTNNLLVTGTVTASNFGITSDRRLKTNIVKIENALDVLDKFTSYEYIKDGKQDAGFIAQEVQEVLPYAVFGSGKEMLSMNDRPILAYMHQAILELKSKNIELTKEIAQLKLN